MSGHNKVLVPQARAGLDRFKCEIAREIGISDYDIIDKGNLTTRENGLVGGNMVKKMIESYEKDILS